MAQNSLLISAKDSGHSGDQSQRFRSPQRISHQGSEPCREHSQVLRTPGDHHRPHKAVPCPGMPVPARPAVAVRPPVLHRPLPQPAPRPEGVSRGAPGEEGGHRGQGPVIRSGHVGTGPLHSAWPQTPQIGEATARPPQPYRWARGGTTGQQNPGRLTGVYRGKRRQPSRTRRCAGKAGQGR